MTINFNRSCEELQDQGDSSNTPGLENHQDLLEQELLDENIDNEINRTEQALELQTSFSNNAVKQARTGVEQQQQLESQNEEKTASESEFDDSEERNDDYDASTIHSDNIDTRINDIAMDCDTIDRAHDTNTTPSRRELDDAAIVNEVSEANEEMTSNVRDTDEDVEVGFQQQEQQLQQLSFHEVDQSTLDFNLNNSVEEYNSSLQGITGAVTNNNILQEEVDAAIEIYSVAAPIPYNVDAVLVVDAVRSSSTSLVVEPLLVDAEPIVDTNCGILQQQLLHQQMSVAMMNTKRSTSERSTDERKSIVDCKKLHVLVCLAVVVLFIVIVTVSLVLSRNSNASDNTIGTVVPDNTSKNTFSKPSNVLDVSTYNHVTRHGLLFESRIDCDNVTLDMKPYVFMRVMCGNARIADGLEALKIEQSSKNVQCMQEAPNFLMCNATLSRNISKFAAIILCGRQEIIQEEPIASVQTSRISGTQCRSEPSMKVGVVRLCSKTSSSKTISNSVGSPSVVDDSYYNIQSSMGIDSGCPDTDMVTSTTGNWSFCKTQQPCPSISGSSTYPCLDEIKLRGVTALDNMHTFGSSTDEVCPMTYEPLNETAMWSQIRTILQQSEITK